MNEYTGHNKTLYHRLIAMWVVCEAFAGGLMHAAKIPFTGMIISSFSVTSVILIAQYFPSAREIIRATLIVAVFKLMLSPGSPPTAYLALFFQGGLGQLLFYKRQPTRVTAVLLAVLSLIESAVQRILVLLIIYGNGFWQAVDRFITKLIGSNDNNYSSLLACGYIIIHGLVGIFIGLSAMRLVKRSMGNYNDPLVIHAPEPYKTNDLIPAKKKKAVGIFYLTAWIFILLLLIQALVDPSNAVLPSNETFLIFLRAIVILAGWYLLVGPLVMRWLKKRLMIQQQERDFPLNEILQLIPGTKFIFTESWKMSSAKRGIRRIRLFVKIVIVNILSNPVGESVNKKTQRYGIE